MNDIDGEQTVKRAGSITIISLLMLWLAIAGLMNAWSILNGSFELPQYYGLIALTYGITAGATSVLLWLMRPPALLTLRLWMATCVVFILLFGFSSGDIAQGGLMGLFGFLVFIGVIFAMLDQHVKRKLPGATDKG